MEKKTYKARWYQKNKKKMAEARRKRHAQDPSVRRRALKKYAEDNKEKIREIQKKYRAKNSAYYVQKCAERYAKKRGATPKWANEFFISEIYDLSRRRTALTGIRWCVDHIVPLRSDKVCGLHTEANLTVIPYTENQRKGNRCWPDMA